MKDKEYFGLENTDMTQFANGDDINSFQVNLDMETLFSDDIATFNLYRKKKTAADIAFLQQLDNFAVIQVRATGDDWTVDHILSVSIQKVVNNVRKKPIVRYFSASYIPYSMFKYMKISESEFNQVSAKDEKSQTEAISDLVKYLSDVESVAIYYKSDIKAVSHLFSNDTPKALKNVFYLQDFYKEIDTGMTNWKYGIKGLLYRLQLEQPTYHDTDLISAEIDCLLKLKKIFLYANPKTVENKYKEFNHDRNIVRDVSVIGYDDDEKMLRVDMNMYNPEFLNDKSLKKKEQNQKFIQRFFIRWDDEKDEPDIIPDESNFIPFDEEKDLTELMVKMKTTDIGSYLASTLDF